LTQREAPEDGGRSSSEVPRLLRPNEEMPAQLQSMEAMGRLAGGIAHVFNNLLTAIACETELALLRLPSSDDPARKHLREIERVGERGAALARQLLAFSGRQVLQPKLVQLNSVLTALDDKLRWGTPSSSGWRSTPTSTASASTRARWSRWSST
jgi:signal transduction histidine kinase